MLNLAAGDFNGDGNPDLAVTNGKASGGMVILVGKGDGAYTVSPVSVRFVATFMGGPDPVGSVSGRRTADLTSAFP
jgi:hypothetical protein